MRSLQACASRQRLDAAHDAWSALLRRQPHAERARRRLALLEQEIAYLAPSEEEARGLLLSSLQRLEMCLACSIDAPELLLEVP